MGKEAIEVLVMIEDIMAVGDHLVHLAVGDHPAAHLAVVDHPAAHLVMDLQVPTAVDRLVNLEDAILHSMADHPIVDLPWVSEGTVILEGQAEGDLVVGSTTGLGAGILEMQTL